MFGNRSKEARAWPCSVLLLVLAAGLAGCGGGDNQNGAEGPPPPNTLAEYLPIGGGHDVVVISFDALRAGELGVYGYERPTSPNVDAFAKDALVFDNAITAGKDTPTSFASAFSGELPFRVFRGWHLQHVPTLASTFSAAGYTTAAILHNAQLAPERGFNEGFDHYDFVRSRLSDDEVVKRADTWLANRPDGRFLLWVHFLSPHTPYVYRDFAKDFYDPDYQGPFMHSSGSRLGPEDVPTKADHDRLRNLYDGEVRYLDRSFAKVIQSLKAHGAWDNSIVIVTADHGEAFGEHNAYGHDRVYREVLHIPLIIRHPDAAATGRTEMRYSNVDLLPTLATMLGVKHPKYLDGVSLVSSPYEKRPFVSVAMTNKNYHAFGVRVGTDKMVVKCSPRSRAERIGLYDHATDAVEQNDILQAHPDTADLLFEFLQDQAGDKPCHAIRDAVQGKSIEEGLSDERIEELRSLGYIQ